MPDPASENKLFCASALCLTQHILFACKRCCSVNDFGDEVLIQCIIALKWASGLQPDMKSNRPLPTTCAICPGDLFDSRCNNCQRNEVGGGRGGCKKQSPQAAITSYFGGAENKRDWNGRKYHILSSYGPGQQGNRSFTVAPFQAVMVSNETAYFETGFQMISFSSVFLVKRRMKSKTSSCMVMSSVQNEELLRFSALYSVPLALCTGTKR